jgi:hypothetical protein
MEDSSVVVKQFLSAHAALEQSWCNHWGAAGRLDRWSSDQDAAMAALESALVVHSAAASGLQEGMHIFDPAVVVSLQTSRQQAQSFKTDSAASTTEATSRHASIKKRCSRLFISRAEKLVTLASRVTAAAESGFEFISWSATRVEVPMEVLAALCKDQAAERAPMEGQLEQLMALQKKFQAARGLQDYVNYGAGYIDGRYLTGAQFKAESAKSWKAASSLHKKIFKLSAGDWFMKAALRREQAHLENAISVP